MKTHDKVTVSYSTWTVVGDEDLDEGYNKLMLPPTNPRFSVQPKVKRYESQRRDVKVRRCLQCGELDHYNNTRRNPRVEFDAGIEADTVVVDNLVIPR